MSSAESIGRAEQPEEVSLGMQWLRLIDREQSAGSPTGFTKDGKPILVEDFYELCPGRVQDMFRGLQIMRDRIQGQNLPPEDAKRVKYEGYVTAAQGMFDKFFSPPQET